MNTQSETKLEPDLFSMSFDDLSLLEWHEHIPSEPQESPESCLPESVGSITRSLACSPITITHIRPESEASNIEYKLKLQPNPQRLQRLITQLNFRLLQGSGTCCYQIGVSDKGFLDGQPRDIIFQSLGVIRVMAEELHAQISSQTVYFAVENRDGSEGWIEEALLGELTRTCLTWQIKLPHHCIAEVWISRVGSVSQPFLADDFNEVRVAVCGDAGSGKSTLISVLSKGELDNGNGQSRNSVLRHVHEVQSGHTSSLTSELIGFDENVCVNTVGALSSPTISEICSSSNKILLLQDLAGHAKYFSTTLFGLSAQFPDYAALVISSTSILPEVSRPTTTCDLKPADTGLEQLEASLALNIPVFVVITKHDLVDTDDFNQILGTVRSLAQRFGKIPLVMDGHGNNDKAIADFSATQWLLCPVFVVSNVTGLGISTLRCFLSQLYPTSRVSSAPSSSSDIDQQELDFLISSTYSRTPEGDAVVGGVLLRGLVHVGQRLFVGPADCGDRYVACVVTSIQVQGIPVNSVCASKSCSFALSTVSPVRIRRGMAVTNTPDAACWEFEITAQLFKRHGAPQRPLAPRQHFVVFAGAVRQLARLVSVDHDACSTSRSRVCFRFVHHPEHMRPFSRLLFRDNRVHGAGTIIMTRCCLDSRVDSGQKI